MSKHRHPAYSDRFLIGIGVFYLSLMLAAGVLSAVGATAPLAALVTVMLAGYVVFKFVTRKVPRQ